MPNPRAANRRMGLLALVVIGLVVGGAAWFLRSQDGGGSEPRIVVTERPARETPADPADALTPESTNRLAAERSAAPIAPPPDPMQLPAPASFTRELAGLRGRVVEEDGTPVPEKKVELLRIHPDVAVMSLEEGFTELPKEFVDPIVDSTKTDQEGRFVLGNASVATMALLGVDLGGPRGTVRLLDVSLERGQTADLGDIVLPPHVTFTGVVVSEDGVPLDGARVRVLPQIPVPIPTQVLQVGIQDIRVDCAAIVVSDIFAVAGELDRMVVEMPPWIRTGFERLPLPTTTTDEEGRFRLPGIPAGIVTLIADKPGHLGIVRSGLPTGRRAEQDVGTTVLLAGRTVTGRAVAGETPVAGARVLVGTAVPIPIEDGLNVAVGQPAGVTDADGRFQLTGLPLNGAVLCAIERQRGDPWTVLGPFNADDVILELPAVAMLTVGVVDPDGKPVEGAALRFREDDEFHEIPIFSAPRELAGRVQEQGEGRYVVNDLPTGKWVVLARAAGFGVGAAKVTLPPEGASVSVPLVAARSLAVRVAAAGDGSPVEHALVTAHARVRGMGQFPYKTTRSDATGAAKLTQLPADEPLLVRVSHPGFALGVAKVEPAPEGSAEISVDVALLRGGDLAGVVRVGGEPPAKPLMLILGKRGNNEVPESEFPHFALTNSDGSYRVRHLVPGEWNWNVFPRFFANDPAGLIKTAMDEPEELARGQCTIAEGVETRLDIDARSEVEEIRGIVRGRARVDGATQEGLAVQLYGRRRFDTTSTDASGRFEFLDRRPGEYTVEVVRGENGGHATLMRQKFTLQPGEAKELDLDVATIAVRVRVRSTTGEPIGGANVAARPIAADEAKLRAGESSVTTGDDGTAMLSLSAGKWRLDARHEERGRVVSTIDVTENGQDIVTLELDPGTVVRGRYVVDHRPASPDEDWYLSLQRVSDEGIGDGNWVSVKAGEEKFEFKAVMPGRYRLQLYAEDAGIFLSDEFEVVRDRANDLDLRLERGD